MNLFSNYLLVVSKITETKRQNLFTENSHGFNNSLGYMSNMSKIIMNQFTGLDKNFQGILRGLTLLC